MNKKYVIRQTLLATFVGLVAGILSGSVTTGFIVGLLPFVLMMALYPARRDRIDAGGKPVFDERETMLDYRAARFAWAFVCIALGAVIMYFDLHLQQVAIPLQTINGILISSVCVYMGLKFWFRRA